MVQCGWNSPAISSRNLNFGCEDSPVCAGLNFYELKDVM